MKKVFTHMLIPKKSVRFLPWLGGMCLFLFTSFLVPAHERAKDESSQRSGAEVLVMSSNGVTTDADGRYFTYSLL